ncbi:ATPase domain-containing protein [Halobellus inordinatus]|uniref:ATPase domain-containing protein n=1 Tax=Halobellus inordinatus TaxID=1126236 RepID=UPI00210EE70D|nr:ATPase domain-containing protein [Halobellus inordinatus]
MHTPEQSFTRSSSGIPGLDSLLEGGFVDGRLYLVLGVPGTGKTLLGTEFLCEGLSAGETVLFIHGEESADDLRANAAELGIDIRGANFLDVGPESDFFKRAQSYDVVDPQDIEDGNLIAEVRDAIEELDPGRVLIDPITQFQYLEPSEYQFRKRIISFARYLKNRGTTVLATKTPHAQMDMQLRSLSDGVIVLEYEDEKEGRRIHVPKHRGVGQRDGRHGLEIRGGGLQVYPALQRERHARTFEPDQFTSDISELDSLIGGGLERGTVTIITGPSGVGKTTTATEFLATAAANGERALTYLFEESIETFTYRSEAFGHPITRLREEGSLFVNEIDSLTQSPEEFADRVVTEVQDNAVELVVIDGIEGYKTAIKGAGEAVELRRRLHALTQHLVDMNVSVILIDQRTTVTGLPEATSEHVSYIADNIVFQNYIELEGELQRIAGVLKKRVGGFETVPRRYTITADGLQIGEPVTGIHGVLNGVPERTSETTDRSR